MYGSERYQIGMPEQGLPNVRMPGAESAAAFGSQQASGFAAVGEGLRKLAAVAMQKQDEQDMLNVEAANNEYKRQLLLYVNDPQTGILYNRMGKDAQGVSDEFGTKSHDMAEQVKKDLKLNARQSAMFDRVSINSADPFYKTVQNHEAQQYQVYKNQEYADSVDASVQTSLMAPTDNEVYEHQMQQIEASMRLHNPGASEETIKNMMLKTRAEVETKRLGVVADTNPGLAQSMLETSTNLDPEQRMKAADYIKQLQQKKWQDNEVQLQQAYLNNQTVSRNQIKQMVASNTISPAMGARWAETFENRAEHFAAEAERVANKAWRYQYDHSTYEDKEFMAQEKMGGPTKTESLGKYSQLMQGIEDGTTTIDDIILAGKRNLVTPTYIDLLKKSYTSHQQVQNKLLNSDMSMYKTTIRAAAHDAGIADSMPYVQQFESDVLNGLVPPKELGHYVNGILVDIDQASPKKYFHYFESDAKKRFEMGVGKIAPTDIYRVWQKGQDQSAAPIQEPTPQTVIEKTKAQQVAESLSR